MDKNKCPIWASDAISFHDYFGEFNVKIYNIPFEYFPTKGLEQTCYFNKSDFRCRFEDKGRLRKYLEKIPTYVITHEFPAFLGVSYALDTIINQGYLP